MALIDPSTPANVQPVGQTGGFTLSFSDEFNNNSLDTTKWTDYADWYQPRNTDINYDTNAGSNSCLRVWPSANRSTAQFNSHQYLQDPDRLIHTRNSFRQLGGYFEWKIRACVGQGQWPGMWMYHESVHDEFDVWEPIVPGNYSSTGWGFVRADGQLSPGNFGGNAWYGPDPVSTADSRKWSDGGGGPFAPLDMAASNRWCYVGLWWDNVAQTARYFFYWQDGTGALNGGEWKSFTYTHQTAQFMNIQLALGNSGGTVLDSLVKGSSNSMFVDWARAWTIGGSTPPPPTSTSAAPVTAPFDVRLTDAPVDGATVGGNAVRFAITGHNVKNAELLPASGYTPVYGRFTLTQLSGSATDGELLWDTLALSNGSITVRVSAFDVPPGGTSANEIVAMAARTYIINNVTNSASATVVTAEPAVQFFTMDLDGFVLRNRGRYRRR